MKLTTQQLSAALDTIASNISEAANEFDEALEGDPMAKENCAWDLELVYAQLLTLAEALNLPQLRSTIQTDFDAARAHLLAEDDDGSGRPYLKWAAPARRHLQTIRGIFASDPSRTVTKDLESILRAALYSITDRAVFGAPPQNEAQLHQRLEAVLRSVFPDLTTKPALSKPIKNFIPDTGIGAIQTLIEYKFLSSADGVGQIADQLLADTRGYTSPEWTSFVYVIYETQRFRPEAQWRRFMRECGMDSRTLVVLLSGEPLDSPAGTRTLPRRKRSDA